MSTLSNVIQDVRKRDDEARTFAPQDNDEVKELAEITKARIKTPESIDPISTERMFDKMKRSKDFKMDEFLKNRYDRINLDDINNLIDKINSEITEGDNIVDLGNNKEVYFRDLTGFFI